MSVASASGRRRLPTRPPRPVRKFFIVSRGRAGLSRNLVTLQFLLDALTGNHCNSNIVFLSSSQRRSMKPFSYVGTLTPQT